MSCSLIWDTQPYWGCFDIIDSTPSKSTLLRLGNNSANSLQIIEEKTNKTCTIDDIISRVYMNRVGQFISGKLGKGGVIASNFFTLWPLWPYWPLYCTLLSAPVWSLGVNWQGCQLGSVWLLIALVVKESGRRIVVTVEIVAGSQCLSWKYIFFQWRNYEKTYAIFIYVV